jgi:thiamine transport system ATP-binding protein/spermidine/putrescine transport system ATP-binding protein
MSRIELDGLTKVYGSDVVAVDDIDLTVEDGEFVTLVGPSGCGKTTTLRCIAGFETVTDGRIAMDDREITAEPPYRRDVGMVFQSFALFPHMTVEENVAYGMRVADRDFSDTEVDDRVTEMLSMIELPGIEERMPSQLSGGQQQRVALARALALNPGALLLDEPLASLDEKLRKQMQAELSRIQKDLGVTTVFVTHNQEEAMTMSDRIVVLNDGEFEQVGSPDTVYHEPESIFVADFIGKANVFRGSVTGGEEGVVDVDTDTGVLKATADDRLDAGTDVGVVVRPEGISLERHETEDAIGDGGTRANVTAGEVNLVQMLGGTVEYRVYTDAGTELIVTTQAGEQRATPIERGDRVRVSFAAERARALSIESIVENRAVDVRSGTEAETGS